MCSDVKVTNLQEVLEVFPMHHNARVTTLQKVRKHVPQAHALSNFGMSLTVRFFSNCSTMRLIYMSDASHSNFLENATATNNSTLLSQNISFPEKIVLSCFLACNLPQRHLSRRYTKIIVRFLLWDVKANILCSHNVANRLHFFS